MLSSKPLINTDIFFKCTSRMLLVIATVAKPWDLGDCRVNQNWSAEPIIAIKYKKTVFILYENGWKWGIGDSNPGQLD